MYSNFCFVCIVLCIIFEVQSASMKAPPFIQHCATYSPECLKNSIQSAFPHFLKGVPELGIGTLDPFAVERLDLILPGGLKMTFMDGTTKGLRKCVVDSASLDATKIDLTFHCNLTIKGKYRSVGRLLMFPIDGDGETTIKCRNIQIRTTIKLDTEVKNDGEKYLVVKNYDSSHSYEGQVAYRMTNIFKGNPELSKVVLDFMNSNWKMVAEEFGNPIVNFGVSQMVDNVKKLFSNVPVHELIRLPIFK